MKNTDFIFSLFGRRERDTERDTHRERDTQRETHTHRERTPMDSNETDVLQWIQMRLMCSSGLK